MAHHDVALVLLRRALRLADNPALADALAHAGAVVPVFVHDPASAAAVAPGAASRAWLARSLAALDRSLQERGSGLVVRAGGTVEALATLAAECGATAIYFDERFEPDAAAADAATRMALEAVGLETHVADCALLRDPDGPRTGSGGPYRVFTPYFDACRRLGSPGAPLPAPERIASPRQLPPGLDPALAADGASEPPGLARYFAPGEAGATAAAERFYAEAIAGYPDDRDRPGIFGTSRLSPHLAFGEISARQLVADAEALIACDGTCPGATGAREFARQLHWREFAYHTLHHAPDSVKNPLRAEYARMPWIEDPDGVHAWQEGRTGFPLVDAGMRELIATGWMHNRVRMVAASFLTKDLLVPWQTGERYFRECLVDADVANNVFGWQWVAGSGADAAPYFRVFNPVSQGVRFDPSGDYVRTWVPELATLPDRFIHRPWDAPPQVLAEAGVALGTTYPLPIVDHAEARRRALAAYASIRG